MREDLITKANQLEKVASDIDKFLATAHTLRDEIPTVSKLASSEVSFFDDTEVAPESFSHTKHASGDLDPIARFALYK